VYWFNSSYGLIMHLLLSCTTATPRAASKGHTSYLVSGVMARSILCP
jgi:hypothetical protein